MRIICQNLLPTTELMAVVKADGYGHGAEAVARAALHHGAAWLGLGNVREALEIREAGITAPILVLTPPPKWHAAAAVSQGLRVAVCTEDLARALSKEAQGRNLTARVHVKVDTGMGRLGVLPCQAVDFISRISRLPNLEIEGVFSHFATADRADQTYAKQQFQLFEQMLQRLAAAGIRIPIKHMANTAAALNLPETQLSIVRSGIAIYGLGIGENPRQRKPNGEQALNLEPAMELKASVSYVHRVAAGSAVSYNAVYVTSKATNIVTLPIGYAEGYSRLLSGSGEVLLGGKRYPLVGNICMSQCMADVGDDVIDIGETAVFLGEQGCEYIGADEIAAKMGTIHYEVICRLSGRVPRVYKGKEAERQGLGSS